MSKFAKRAVPILILAVLVLSIIPALLPPAMALTKPTLENTKTPWVGQAKGDKGDVVIVTGVDGEIPAGSDVKLYWDSLVAWDGVKGLLNTTEAESSGNYEVWFDVPEAVTGAHYVWVYSEALDDQNSAKFTVKPLVTLDPDAGLVGEKITVKGYGFGDEVDVAVAGFGSIGSVTNELVGVGDGVEDEFTLDYWPVVKGTLSVTWSVYGAMTNLTDYTVNYATGKITFEEGSIPPLGIEVRATYQYYAGISKTTTNTRGSFTKTITVTAGTPAMVWAVDKKGVWDSESFAVGPVIELTPELDSVGSIIRVRGRGFTANGEIDPDEAKGVVELQRGAKTWDCYVIDAPISIDSDGDFRMDIVVPQGDKVADDYVIYVEDDMGLNSDADFEVTGLAEIEVEPDFGAQGETATIYGYNFTKISGKKVKIHLGTVELGIEPKVDSNGEFEAEFTILGDAGPQTLKAEMADYNIMDTTPFKVGLMIVILSPDEAPTGKMVTMTGSGFTADGTWNATLGDITLFESEPVNGESFSIQFYVPTIDVGTYTVSVWDIEAEIEVTTELEVTDTTTLTLEPAGAPNRGPDAPMYNVTIKGEFFLRMDETIEFVLYNVTAGGEVDQDWDMEVKQMWDHDDDTGTANVERNARTNTDGEFEAWWELFDNETLGLGDYIVNATQEGPNEEEIFAQFNFSVIEETIQITTRKTAYAIGDTLAFDIESSWKETESYIKVMDPEGDLYWKTDDLDTWVKVGTMYVCPYYGQTAGGNPMIFASDAPLGTWSWTYYSSTDRVLDSGSFSLAAAPEAILEERIAELADDLGIIAEDIAGVKSDVAGVKSDVSSAKAAADAAKAAADSAAAAISDVASVANSAKAAADAAKTSADAAKTAADDAKSAAGGLSTLVYAAIGASVVAALAAIVSLMQISRRIAG